MSVPDDQQLRSLAALARALGQSAGIEAMLEIATAEILPGLGADSVSISRLEPGSWILRTLINAGALGPTEEPKPQSELYRLEDFGHFAHVFRKRQTWIASLADSQDERRADIALLHTLQKGSSLTTPLIVDGALWGELYAAWFSLEGAGGASHAYVDAVTAILAGAISRAQHVESLEELAYRDPLTGLANRRALDAAAAQVFADSVAGAQRRVSAVAIDINDLKSLNDSVGHHQGDLLIKAIAAELTRQFTPLYGSLAARVGGDEFSVLVPGHRVGMVTAAADAFCIRTRAITRSRGVACGIASTVLTDGHSAPRHLFTAADRAMYEAKRTGHATAVVAPETASLTSR
jgi:diguanylate cyclase (GGDEF)-like protein